MREDKINIHVICDTCRTELTTILEKKNDVSVGSLQHDFEMRVEPCPTCIVDEPEEEVISLTLNLTVSVKV